MMFLFIVSPKIIRKLSESFKVVGNKKYRTSIECELTKPPIYKEHWYYFLILGRFVSFIVSFVL